MEEFKNPIENRRKIIAKNVTKIESDIPGYISMESIGGNAGLFEAKGRGFPCAGIVCIVDKDTGELVTFLFAMEPYEGESPEKIRSLMLRVAVGYDEKFSYNFVRIIEVGNMSEISPNAQEVFNESVRQFNEKN